MSETRSIRPRLFAVWLATLLILGFGLWATSPEPVAIQQAWIQGDALELELAVCHGDLDIETEEDDQEVRIRVVDQRFRFRLWENNCASVANLELDQPLGERPLFDESTGSRIRPIFIELTADQILADGEITAEEREEARHAVFRCVIEAGADTTLELFDVDPVVKRDYWDHYNACFDEFKGIVVDRPQGAQLFDLSLLGVVSCVEHQLGEDLGPKTVDLIGRLTPESLETIDAALNADRDLFLECRDLPTTFDLEPADQPVVSYEFDGSDPKRIHLQVASCGYFYGTWLESEKDDSVVVRFLAPGEHHQENCWTRHPVRLKDPLGDRSLIDATTGEEILQDSG